MKDYEISKETLAILPVGENKSKVIEKDCSFIINNTPKHIMDDSCRYYGSSIEGRQKGTNKLTGISYKAPIVIQEENALIFFPTSSPRLKKCSWLSLNNIDRYYYDYDRKTSVVVFENGVKVDLDTSFCILNNQILKSHRLESVFQKRREI